MHISEFRGALSHVIGGSEQFTARCPAHDDRHNSLSVSVGDDQRILVKCHAGCSTESVLERMSLNMSDLFVDPPRARASGSLYLVKTSHAHNPYPVPDKRVLPDTRDTSLSVKPVATKAHPETARQTIYPYEDADGHLIFEAVRYQYNDGSKTFRQRRLTEGGYVYNLDGVEPPLYRLPRLRECIAQRGGVIFLCEGEKDADALNDLGETATTAPMGAGKWRERYTEQLRGASFVYIVPDNDKPGRAHALAVGQALEDANIAVGVADPVMACPELPLKGDVSDVLNLRGRDGLVDMITHVMTLERFKDVAAERDRRDDGVQPYVFDTAEVYLHKGFLDDLRRQREGAVITTGFAKLDEQLGGRLYPGLYVIGAVSSLGKTAFCLQIADHIASGGVDVLFFSLEMPRVEMVARSLTRELFLSQKGRGDYNIGHILYGRVDEALMEAATLTYSHRIGRYIAFIEGGFNVDADGVGEYVRRHVQATGHHPVVFVDYLQILRPVDPRMSDKQAVDYNVIALKRLSRDLNIPVIAVSSFNRQNYAEEVNMASFKESGAIEYSADFVMGLQARGVSDKADELRGDERKVARAVMAETKKAKQMDPRPIEAVTLKNRRGPAWARFGLEFYAKGNLFFEV